MSSSQRAILSRIPLLRYFIWGAFVIYLAYSSLQLFTFIQANLSPAGIRKLLESSLLYDFILFLILFAVIDALIGYFQRALTNVVKNADEIIIGTISSYNNKLTLSELAMKFKLKEDELEKILAIINAKGEYSVQIEKETKVVSITPVVSLIGAATKEEKLQKLEELFEEGKISERTYRTLKEKYSKEKQ